MDYSQHRLDYCQFLIGSQINYTQTYLADHSESYSHDSMNRSWSITLVLPHKPCSGCQQDTLPQQVEVGSPIQLPFERFKPIDLTFDLTVAIRCF